MATVLKGAMPTLMGENSPLFKTNAQSIVYWTIACVQHTCGAFIRCVIDWLSVSRDEPTSISVRHRFNKTVNAMIISLLLKKLQFIAILGVIHLDSQFSL